MRKGREQGWNQKSSDMGTEASDKGTSVATKCNYGTSFCKISSDKNPKSPPTGARCLRRGALGSSSPPLAPPLEEGHSYLFQFGGPTATRNTVSLPKSTVLRQSCSPSLTH